MINYLTNITVQGTVTISDLLTANSGITLGSFGTLEDKFGDLLIGTPGKTGLRFDDIASGIVPWDMNLDTAAAGTIDLGTSTARFKEGWFTSLDVSGTIDVATINATTLSDGYVEWTAAQFNRVGGNIEFQWNGGSGAGVRFFGNTAYDATFDGLTGNLNLKGGINTDGNITATSGDITGNRFYSNNQAAANNELVRLDQLNSILGGLDWQESVLDQLNLVSSEPASPTVGDRYISLATGTSSVTSQAVIIHYIYEWNGTDWSEFIPNKGWTSWVEDIDTNYTYNGSTWVEFGSTVSHNNTTGLQGGESGNYYHLGLTDYTNLTSDSGNIAYNNINNGFSAIQTFSQKIILDNATSVSPYLEFKSDTATVSQYLSGNRISITRDGNSGLDFSITTDASDYQDSYITVGGSIITKAKIDNWAFTNVSNYFTAAQYISNSSPSLILEDTNAATSADATGTIFFYDSTQSVGYVQMATDDLNLWSRNGEINLLKNTSITGTLTTTSNINAGNDIVLTGNMYATGVVTTLSNNNLQLSANGTGEVNILKNTNITGSLDVSENITFGNSSGVLTYTSDDAILRANDILYLQSGGTNFAARFDASQNTKLYGNLTVDLTSTFTGKVTSTASSDYSFNVGRGIEDDSRSTWSHYFSAGNAHRLGRSLVLESSLYLSPTTPSDTTPVFVFRNDSDILSLRVSNAGTLGDTPLSINGATNEITILDSLTINNTVISDLATLDITANGSTNGIVIRTRSTDDVGNLRFMSNDGSYNLGGLSITQVGTGGGDLSFSTALSNGTSTVRYIIDNSGNHDFRTGTATFGANVTVDGIITSNANYIDSIKVFSGVTEIGDILASGGELKIQGSGTRNVSLGSGTNPDILHINGNTKLSTFGGNLTINGTNVYQSIESNNPILYLEDIGGTGSAMNSSYIGYRDSTGTTQAWVGFGDTTTDFNIQNNLGDVTANGNKILQDVATSNDIENGYTVVRTANNLTTFNSDFFDVTYNATQSSIYVDLQDNISLIGTLTVGSTLDVNGDLTVGSNGVNSHSIYLESVATASPNTSQARIYSYSATDYNVGVIFGAQAGTSTITPYIRLNESDSDVYIYNNLDVNGDITASTVAIDGGDGTNILLDDGTTKAVSDFVEGSTTTWQTLTITHGSPETGSTIKYKKINGRLIIIGNIGTTSGSTTYTIGTLAVGYRPDETRRIVIHDGIASARIEVRTDGDLVIYDDTSSSTFYVDSEITLETDD